MPTVKVPIPKPRNKRLNDILVSKRNVRFADPKLPSRAKQKQQHLKNASGRYDQSDDQYVYHSL